MHPQLVLEPDLEVLYDPLIADPDYLVTDSIGEAWQISDSALQSGSFELTQEFTRYKVYERVR